MDSKEPLNPYKKESNLRIILLGRIGAGKSSAGNTILSETKPFEASPVDNPSSDAVTKSCKLGIETIDEQQVTVIDTPGLCNPEKKEEDVLKKIKKSIKLASPGPHVFLIVLKADDKFTKELQDMVELICSTFGKNTLAYTMVLFISGDLPQTIVDLFQDSKTLGNLIIQCHWQYHVFDNTKTIPEQVRSLLKKINSMIERSRGSYYTPEMLQDAEEANKLLQDRKQQQQQQQQLTQNPEADGMKAKRGPVKTFALVGVSAGCLMGYLLTGGVITSSMGAALGGLAGALLGGGSAILVKLTKNTINNMRG